jgi:hypothetical protein
MSKRKQLPIGTKVKFDIGQGLDTGKALITDVHKDQEDGHFYYKLDVIEGSNSDLHRDEKGELWVNSFEVKAIK